MLMLILPSICQLDFCYWILGEHWCWVTWPEGRGLISTYGQKSRLTINFLAFLLSICHCEKIKEIRMSYTAFGVWSFYDLLHKTNIFPLNFYLWKFHEKTTRIQDNLLAITLFYFISVDANEFGVIKRVPGDHINFDTNKPHPKRIK